MAPAVILAAALALGGCARRAAPGGDPGGSGGPRDGGVPTEASAGGDAALSEAGKPIPPTTAGRACTRDADCGAGLSCVYLDVTGDYLPAVPPLRPSSLARGVCAAPCRHDDARTRDVDEDSCTGGQRCVSVPLVGGRTGSYCFSTCRPRLGGNDCRAPIACLPRTAGPLAANVALCALPGCVTDADCPVTTTRTCTLGGAACPGGQRCVPTRRGSNQGRCALPGRCDTASGLCAPRKAAGTFRPAASVGDPCAADTECGANMHCQLQRSARNPPLKAGGAACKEGYECCSGFCSGGRCELGACRTFSRNGICVVSGCTFAASLPAYACPKGSGCHNLFVGGVCLARCNRNDPSTCRGVSGDRFGDYECRDWSGLVLGPSRLPVSSGPLCEWGSAAPCDAMAGLQGGCANLEGPNPGASPLPMRCRDPDSGAVLSNPGDPRGYCLDATGSGPATP